MKESRLVLISMLMVCCFVSCSTELKQSDSAVLPSPSIFEPSKTIQQTNALIPTYSEVLNITNCPVSAFDWAPDGKTIAIGCRYGGIYIYEINNWEEIQFIPTSGRTDNSGVQDIDYSPDGLRLIYSVWNQIYLFDFDLNNSTPVLPREFVNAVGLNGNLVEFSRDGETFLLRNTSHPDNGVIIPHYGVSIWNLFGTEIHSFTEQLPDAKAIWDVTYSPDGYYIVGASLDNSIYIWNSTSGVLIDAFTDHDSDVFSISFHPTTQVLASGSADATIRFWDVTNRILLQTLSGFTDQISHILYTPDGTELIAILFNGEVHIWNVGENGLPDTVAISEWSLQELINNYPYHFPQYVDRVEISPDGNYLTVMNDKGDLYLISPEKGKTEYEMIAATPTSFVTVTPDGTEEYLTTRINSPTVTSTPTIIPTREPIKHTETESDATFADQFAISDLYKDQVLQEGQLLSAAWSSDGKIISIAEGNRLLFYDSENLTLIRMIHMDGLVLKQNFSPDDKYLLYMNDHHYVCVMDLSTEENLFVSEENYWNTELSFPDNETISIFCLGILETWNFKTGELLSSQGQYTTFPQTLSPNHEFTSYQIGMGNGESWALKIVDNETKNIVKVIERDGASSDVGAILFSMDGKYFVTSNYVFSWVRTTSLTTWHPEDNQIDLWKIEEDHSVTHTKTIENIIGQDVSDESNVFFSPDSQYVFVLHPDRALQVWQSETGEFIGEYEPRGDFLLFSPTGTEVLILKRYGGLSVWKYSNGSIGEEVGEIGAFGSEVKLDYKNGILAGSFSYEIRSWKLQEDGMFLPAAPIELDTYSSVLSLSADRQLYAVNGQEGSIALLDWHTGKTIKTFSGHPEGRYGFVRLTQVLFSPDGNFLVSIGSNQVIRLWRVNNGSLLNEFYSGYYNDIYGHALFIDNDHLLVSPNVDGTTLYDLSTKTASNEFKQVGDYLVFRPNSYILSIVHSASGKIQNIDINDGLLLDSWQVPEDCEGLIYSPDGTLALTNHDMRLYFWDVRENALIGEKEFNNPIRQVIFADSDDFLILVFKNGEISIWKWGQD